MHWIYLITAGAFEIAFATLLKLSNNFTNILFTVLFCVAACLSFYFLSLSIKTIPVGTAYAVWTGIGASGTAIIGIIYYNEPTDFWRLFFLGLLIIAILGLKFLAIHPN